MWDPGHSLKAGVPYFLSASRPTGYPGYSGYRTCQYCTIKVILVDNLRIFRNFYVYMQILLYIRPEYQ